MKLPIPNAQEINRIAARAEETIKNTTSRSSHLMCVENAIREALALVVDRMNIQINDSLQIDLRKQ
ncbi:hypothetical protein PJKIFABJ_00005 [Pseudomonas phage PE09]|jgi:hypothetical protein|uniref:Uncharacterized protein n=3 Tax=Otagovirus TaxID=2560197 RepID=A0A7S8BDK3_9CAUD|nr:hypothetical protein QGX21_gp003 [Pseudomonas phage phiPsa315]YP_010768134.1 hypothetical protein QGX22_gp005 [Pseudomonas phage PE09]YP_010768312.1 hypothetical protein QGX23_gp004 [Pseudomonas phage PN09]QHZ59960.1 hypothetical protein PJKIFABJ_00005 [Pseudomonas phage PE09]QNO00346.1 hypothetical protein phiPsa315_003 [Pseudomonas phage phiPsa315]QPB10425.1 hypothetical protein PN09_004 [Pseudomonas phage PN09]